MLGMQFSGLFLRANTRVTLLVLILTLGLTAARPMSGQESKDLPQDPGSMRSSAAPTSAATNPNMDPANVHPLVHRFWDRTNILLFAGVGITRGMDYASTRNFQARGRDEILLPDDVVDNSAGFASLEAAGTATSIGISYLLHRTGHHKLERWMSIGHIGVTGFGDVRNYCLKTKHTIQ
jgi:hypothetical protein